MLGLAEAVETLVADVTDDVECYQDALPYGCTVSLPGISCRLDCPSIVWLRSNAKLLAKLAVCMPG
jgi:hypothetical protein